MAVPEPHVARETAPQYQPRGGRLTYEDYCRLPAGNRYELVEGDIRMTPSPSVIHQEISKPLEIKLINWIEGQGLGKVFHAPIDVVLNPRNVVQPDILFVAKERLVKEYWLVDPASKSVEVVQGKGGEPVTAQICVSPATLASPLLPGLTVDLETLFRPLER